MQMGKASHWRSQTGAPGWCWQDIHPPSPRMLRDPLSTSALGPLLSPTKCRKGHGCQPCKISTRQCIEGVICRSKEALSWQVLEGLVSICPFPADGTHKQEAGFCNHFFLSYELSEININRSFSSTCFSGPHRTLK